MDQGCCTDMAWKGNWDPFVRVCYQFGMLLGQDEFDTELGYLLTKHRLSQRLFVGYGVVWGGSFTVDEVAGTLTVAPLFALDELGRELYVPNPCTVDLVQWLADNDVGVGTQLWVAVGYKSCCVAPVPAMAAPCDDAASPTMMSRVLETAECALLDAAPDPAIDLGDPPADPTDKTTQADRFATLLGLIKGDGPRPIALGTVTVTKIVDNPSTGDKKINATWDANPALPRINAVGVGTGAGAGGFRVASAALASTSGNATLDVRFTQPAVIAPATAFSVVELLPPASTGKPWKSKELTSGTVTPDDTDATLVHVALSALPKSGHGYIIRVTGADILASTAQGPIALSADYTRAGVQP